MQQFHKKILDNGITVLLEERSNPVVSLSININSGGEFETAKEKGLHHFIEHIVFKGTKTRSHKQIVEEIERNGGILNAFTSEEITSFHVKIPSKRLDKGQEILSDIFLNPNFDEKEFEKEKKVICEEIKMYKDTPMYYVTDKIKELLYSKPFGLSLAGDISSVQNLTREKIMNHYKEDYKNKVIVSAVGRANFDHLCNLFSKLPKFGSDILKRPLKKINKNLVEKRKGIDQAHFVFGYHSPEIGSEDRYLYDIILTYLASGMSSVFNEEIREKRGLAYAIIPDIDREKNFGYSTIYIGTDKEDIPEIKNIILKEFKNIKEMNQKDFDEVKEQLIGLKQISTEDSMKVMSTLMFEELGKGAEEYYKFEEKINVVKLEDIKNFKLKKYSTFSLIPDK